MKPDNVHQSLKKHMLIEGYPLVIDFDRSTNSYLFDGRTNSAYLDFFSFYAANPLGFNHPGLMNKEFQQKISEISLLKNSNSDCYSVEMAEFVDTVSTTIAPIELPNYFFIDTGALAVENAMKVAFDWKSKKGNKLATKILHFKHAFHGRSGYTLSVTNTDSKKTDLFPKFDWPRVSCPAAKFPLDENNLKTIIKAEEKSLKEIKEQFEKNRDEIAAILIEPIQGEGGDNHFRKEFLQELRNIANEQDVMLIFDEVQTGVGMTGKWWAYQHFDLVPDIVCFSKKMQVGGIFVSEKVNEVSDNVFKVKSRIGSTWGASLVDMVRCSKILKTIVEYKLLDNAQVRGNEFLNYLLFLQQKYADCISNARGLGLMCAIDLPNSEIRDKLVKKCFDNKLIVLGCGQKSIRFRPNLAVSKGEIQECIERFERSLVEL